MSEDLKAARKAHAIPDFEPRQGHLFKWPKGQLITSLVPSFDALDVQLKTGRHVQGRVVGRAQTNCCLMVMFDREIAATTMGDTIRTGSMPARDGDMPGLDMGKRVSRAAPCIPAASRPHLSCVSAASRLYFASISPGVRARQRARAE